MPREQRSFRGYQEKVTIVGACSIAFKANMFSSPREFEDTHTPGLKRAYRVGPFALQSSKADLLAIELSLTKRESM